MNSEIRLDQHLMVDEKLLKEIASYSKDKHIVTEIGPGKGALTKYLLSYTSVNAIELDEFMIHELQKQFRKDITNKKLTITHANALTQKLENTIISNLPYAISEPLFYKIIKDNVLEAYLVTGELFYKRITGTDKLGIIAKHCFTITKIIDVSKESFDPMPKVNSTFFSLIKKEDTIINIIFSQWDKKAKNACIESLCKYGKTKKEAKDRITLPKTIANKKIINLSNEEFKVFYSMISNLQKAL